MEIQLKFVANITHLWAEMPFLDRIDAAAAAGFDGIEVLFPYDISARDIQNSLRRVGMPMVLMNAPPPNYTGGERGFAARPGGGSRFQYDMRRAFRYAEALGVSVLHVMAGEGEGPDCFDTLVTNLKWASRAAPKGLTLTIEPINDADYPGYFLNDYELAAKVLDAVKKPNVRLQFDTYHAQMIHGDALDIWRRFGLRAAHVQFADSPGRIVPGDGTVNFPDLIEAMRQTGYDGWISAEYKTGDQMTENTLRWMKRFRKLAA